MLLQVVASLLLATAASAPLETGDVVVESVGGCGLPLPYQCPWSSQALVIRGDGTLKQSIIRPVWGEEALNELLLQPDRVIFTQPYPPPPATANAEVLVTTTDGRVIADRWRTGLWWKLTNIVPMRSGDFLLAESSPYVLSRLVRLDASGNVTATYTFPVEQFVRGARLIELFADQCMVAWIPQTEEPYADPRVRRTLRAFDICKNTPAADLFVMPPDIADPRIMRQLPDGGFVIVTNVDARRFDATGVQVAVYPTGTFTGFALTPDGRGFWYWDYFEGRGVLQVDFAAPDVIVTRFALDSWSWQVMGVVGEWRASLQPPRPSRRRAVRR